MTPLEEAREAAVARLGALQEKLREKDIPCWLMYGTALGAVREGNVLLKEREDIDIGIPGKCVDEHFFQILYSLGYTRRTRMFIVSDTSKSKWGRRIAYSNITLVRPAPYPIDIYPFYELDEDNYIWLKYEYNGKILGKTYPKKLIDTRTCIKLGGVTCQIPDPPEAFVEHMYGATWRTPIESNDDEQKMVPYAAGWASKREMILNAD